MRLSGLHIWPYMIVRPMKNVESLYTRMANSWWTAALVIFIAFAAASLLLDDFPIYVDGLFSLATAGYDDPVADPTLVLERLVVKSQQHVPGYFLTLFVWGNLLEWSPLAMRLLSVFFGILSLALMYRLGRSLMGKQAGLIALVMLASLAFYNIWYLPIRMYTMFVAAELLLLWLYFRAIRCQRSSLIQLALLCIATVVFLYTHIFSLATIFGIGIYHLLFVPKSRKWFYISAAFLAAALVLLPWLGVMFQGTEYAVGRAGEAINALGTSELLVALISLGTNASVLFLLLLLLAAVRAGRGDKVAIALWVIFLATIGFYLAVNALTGVIDYWRSRYALIVFPLMILMMVKGLTVIARWKLFALCIVIFWLASGMLYHRRVNPAQFVRSYDTIPIHQIERNLRSELGAGDLLTGWSPGLNLYFESVVYGGIADYYFADHNIEVAIEHLEALKNMDDQQIIDLITTKLTGKNRVWLTYELDSVDRYLELWNEALNQRFERCRSDESIINVRMELYQATPCA